jgi:hypothetical protein
MSNRLSSKSPPTRSGAVRGVLSATSKTTPGFYESPRNRSRQSMPVHPGLPHQVAPRPSLLAGALVYFLTNPVGDGSEAKRHEIAALERRFVRTHVSVRQVSSRRGPSLTWRIIAPK